MVAETVPRRLALIVHPTRPVDRALATLTGWASEHGVEVVQLAVDGKRLREAAAPGTLGDGDLVVAVGGDGTVLASVSRNFPNQAVMGQANVEADPRRLIWLGATSFPGRICVAAAADSCVTLGSSSTQPSS